MKLDIGACLDLLRCFGCDLSLVPETASDYFRLALAFIWACIVFIVCVWTVRRFITDMLRSLR